MRYLPTLNLWNSGIHTAVVTGQLKLLSGQWIQCGEGKRSRFIGVHNGVINAVHWAGTGKRTNAVFLTRARIARLQKLLDKGVINHMQFRDYALRL